MVLHRRRFVAQKAAAIIVFLALTANQCRYLIRFHNHDSTRQPQYDPPQNHRRTRYNTTSDGDHQQEHQRNPDTVVVNEIIHRAFFGLGHRLHRSAAAYHLAQSLSSPQTLLSSTSRTDPVHVEQFQHQPVITHLRFHWETCLASDEVRNSSLVDGKEENVFRYLFGDDLWELNYKDDAHASLNYPSAPKGSDSNIKKINKDTISDVKPQIRRNMIVLRNDVPGYIAGQLFKDLKLPINYNPNGAFSRTNETDLPLPKRAISSDQLYEYDVILDKVMRSDVDFYHRLVDNYRFQSEIKKFQLEQQWNERPLVIGLHLRAGNGEDAHFTESGRASSPEADESVMIDRLVRLINIVAIRETKRLWERRVDHGQRWQGHEQNDGLQPLLFIATDTAHLLPLIDKMTRLRTLKDENEYLHQLRFRPHETHILNVTSIQQQLVPLEIVTWPQYRLPKNAGVSFDALKGKGKSCLEGWKSALSDSLLLSKVDVLIAAKRSTFTQSLPLALGFDRNQKNIEDRSSETASFPAEEDDDLGKTAQKPKEIVTSRNRRFSFCEVSEPDMIHITCFTNLRTWLFRGEDERNNPSAADGEVVKNLESNENIWSFSFRNTTSGALYRRQAHQQVEHKVTVLLPDIEPPHEFQQAREFLRHENSFKPNSAGRGSETYESLFHYGKSKINKKYRGVQNLVSKTNNGWNLIYNVT